MLAINQRLRNRDWSHMLCSSLAVAYLSSVVMLISAPALIGISASPVVFPVRISGPFYMQYQNMLLLLCRDDVQHTVSKATARGRPGWVFSASFAWSMTDWWYYNHCQAGFSRMRGIRANLVGTMGKVHTNNVKSNYRESVARRRVALEEQYLCGEH